MVAGSPFSFVGPPRIHFGVGQIRSVSTVVKRYGESMLLVTGSSSFSQSKFREILKDSLKRGHINYFHLSVEREPSPEDVDQTVSKYRLTHLDAVVAVGGGSVIDVGKAISAMLPVENSILDYLEGVGQGLQHSGSKLPLIAVPTTSGTGSEATKNAVFSNVGEDGFKKSLRHDNFVPDVAIVDPELTVSCPPDITAACGMDALTQLLEPYVSTMANDMTDALAWSGLCRTKDNLVAAYRDGNNLSARAAMSYAALMSGIVLANAGLGIIHGLASAIGGLFPIPHGVVCGTLAAAATEVNIRKLHDSEHSRTALEKYARVGRLLGGGDDSVAATDAHKLLIDALYELTHQLKLPPLHEYGVRQAHLAKIISKTAAKNNPAALDAEDIETILLKRL